ncbi:Zinc-metallopeptidase, partial [Durusdinium trenchii]
RTMLTRLHISYQGEKGVDAGGLTRDFFASFARHMAEEAWLWRSTGRGSLHPTYGGKGGAGQMYQVCGRVFAMALLHGCKLGRPLSRPFMRLLLHVRPSSLQELQAELNYEAGEQVDFRCRKDFLETPLADLGLDGMLNFSHEGQEFIPGESRVPELTFISLTVSLPSGASTTVSLRSTSRVADLRDAAQRNLDKRFLRLTAADGSFLDPRGLVKETGLQDGDTVLAIAERRPQLLGNRAAFVLWYEGSGALCAWGEAGAGGVVPVAVAERLKVAGVQRVYATRNAFAALTGEGDVVCWGSPEMGGVIPESVQADLRDVRSIAGNNEAFAAICGEDESVVTWGEVESGGDCSSVKDQLCHVQQISSTFEAFAALRSDGQVICWGDPFFGGNGTERLENVQSVEGSQTAFAAVRKDGTVTAWGFGSSYAETSTVSPEQLCHVQSVKATSVAFAALHRNGAVETWGDPEGGGDSSGVELTNIQLIQSTSWAFAALRSDGTVVTWGSANLGGVVSEQVQAQLVDVEGIESNGWAFVALRSDGSLVCWGDAESGGMVEEVWAQRELVDVVEVKGTERAFTAVRADGSVVSWGHPAFGGDNETLQERLKCL